MKLATAAIAIAVAWSSWFFRYDTTPASTNEAAVAVVLDRWTGQVYFVTPKGWRLVEPQQQLPPPAKKKSVWEDFDSKP